jgi:4'-phosphopantetheinyl transferase
MSQTSPVVPRPKAEKFPCVSPPKGAGRHESPVVLTWPVGPREVLLSATDVHVWSTRLNAREEQVQRCWEVLSCDERQRAERFRFPSDQLRFVVAHGVLRMLLGDYLGIPGSEVRLGYGRFGKPALDVWHESDLHFNLAHSGELAVYGFTRSLMVGIDVESERLGLLMVGVLECSFTSAEQRALAGLPAARQTLASLTLWTRKEAYFKALGCGLQQDLSSVEISVPPAAPALLRRAHEDPKQRHWSFYDLQPARNFVGTLCVENNAETRLWSWKQA